MLYECILYLNGIPVDWYSHIVNEDDVVETDSGLCIVEGHTSHYVSHIEYDCYEINELED